MLRNSEAEHFFIARSAHSDVSSEFIASLSRLGEYEIQGNLEAYGAPFAVTADTVFCGAAGARDTFWRLCPDDYKIAIATGAEAALLGSGWVRVILFRHDWPRPDLEHWALRAYDFAHTGR